MGRPKNLKNKDKVPGLSISTDNNEQKNKRVNFDEDQEENVEVSETKEDRFERELKAAAARNQQNEEKDEAPEEVKADSIEILKLKAQLDQTIRSKKTKSKRKRNANVDADNYLDASVIEALEEEEDDEDDNEDIYNEDNNDFDNNSEFSDERSEESDNAHKHKRKIGHFEITVLDEDNSRISSLYQMSSEVAQFDQNKFQKVNRGNFSKQARLRRPVPSKQFVSSA